MESARADVFGNRVKKAIDREFVIRGGNPLFAGRHARLMTGFPSPRQSEIGTERGRNGHAARASIAPAKISMSPRPCDHFTAEPPSVELF